MTDEAYIYDVETEWVLSEENKYHNKILPIREYIEYKIEQALYSKSKVKYEENPMAKVETYIQYSIEFFCYGGFLLKDKDYTHIEKIYNKLMPEILQIGSFYEIYSILEQSPWIKRLKIFIFGSYFICWSYLLIVSYYNFPIKINRFKIFLTDLKMYIDQDNDVFYTFAANSMHKLFLYKFILKFLFSKAYIFYKINQSKIFIISTILIFLVLLLNLLRKLLEEHLNKKIINIIYNLEKRKQEDEKKDKEENKELYEMKKRLEEQIENWYQNNHKKK
jgi:hypothetical protein